MKVVVTIVLLGWVCQASLKAADDPNEQCLMCHEDPALRDASGRSLSVNKEVFEKSIHGRSGISCVGCHNDLEKIKEFPHAEKLAGVSCGICHEEVQNKFAASIHAHAKQEPQIHQVNCVSCHGYHDILEKSDLNSKSNALNLAQTCGSCHFSKVNGKKGKGFVKGYLESVHGMAISRTGLANSATCITCHSAHEVISTSDPRAPISRRHVPNTCGQCHSGIMKDYLEGVHGKDFVKEVVDVPVCTDCHGEHQIRSPKINARLVYSTHVAQTCAKCHDNDQLTHKYNLPTGRLRTFRGTFHGIASAYGETKVANCASCHGFIIFGSPVTRSHR